MSGLKIELGKYNVKAMDSQTYKKSGVIANGEDNRFGEYLDSLRNNSPTHKAILSDYAFYTTGEGLTSDNAEDIALLEKHFPQDKVEKILDYKGIHRQMNIEVIRSRDNESIAEINPVNPVRFRVVEEQDGEPSLFEYRLDWDSRQRKANYQVLPFNLESSKSLFYWYDSGTYDTVPYGRPEYISGLNPIETEISLYYGDNTEAQNGAKVSGIIMKPSSGDTSTDALDAEQIRNQWSGVENKGKLSVVHYPAGMGNEKPVVQFPNSSNSGSSSTEYEKAEIGIVKAHQLTSVSLIAGLNIKNAGFTDASEEMQWAKNELFSKVIEPRRREFLRSLKPLFNAIGLEGVISFKDADSKNAEVEKTELSAEVSELDNLIGLGQDAESLEGWEIESAIPVDYDMESYYDRHIDNLNMEFVELATSGTARPNAKTEQQGEKGAVKYKVMYRYAGDNTGEREFCRKMLSAKKLYRKEDLVQMGSNSAVNPDFAPVINGSKKKTYPIFEYKGGVNCHHFFERVTLVYKGKGNINQFNPNSPQINQLTESQADERGMDPKNNRLVGIKPINMPNQGRYTLSKLKDLWKAL